MAENALTFDAETMTRLGRVSSVAPSPCGTWLAVAVSRLDADESKYVSDLWRVSASDPDREPVQLTRGDHSDSSPGFRRDGALAFISNRPGEGDDGDHRRSQVWIIDVNGAEPRRLTNEPIGVREFRMASDADVMVVLADVLNGVDDDKQQAADNERRKHGPTALRYTSWPVRHWDHWLPAEAPHVIAYTSDGQQRRDLTPNAEIEHRDYDLVGGLDLSPDGSRVALPSLRRAPDRVFDSSLRVIDTATGESRDFGVADGITHSWPRFSPDSQRLAAVRHLRETGRCGKPNIWIYELGTGEGKPVAQDWDVWPDVHGWTADGAALLVSADLEGHHPAFRLDVAAGTAERITDPTAGGTHTSLHLLREGDEEILVGVRHRLTHPPEPFRAPMRPGSRPTLLATLSGMRPEEGAAIATWESFTVPGDEDHPIQSFLLLPAAAQGPLPGLLWIHGGPIGAFGDGWHWRWNPLVPAAAGYAVAMPNPRGSTGFGQAFIEGIWNNNWGGACYRDLMAVTDALEKRPEIDGSRIAAMGGSFGGYMANWIGGNTDRFRCLVSHAGLYYLWGFHGTTDYPGYFAEEIGANPYENPEAYDTYSPHKFVSTWKTPTLIIHGEKDYRVPVSEALMLFEALQLQGTAAELLIYPDENHWILRPRNARHWYGAFLEFLAAHMQGDS